MKYRVENGCLYLFIECQHEAAVEFWLENERLQSLNAELLAALSKIVADLDELELQASIASDKARNSDVCNYENGKQNAYERAADMVREVIALAKAGK